MPMSSDKAKEIFICFIFKNSLMQDHISISSRYSPILRNGEKTMVMKVTNMYVEARDS